MDPLSITVATITLIQSISSAYNVIQHLKGLPKTFNEVGENLSLAKKTLDLARTQLEASALDKSDKEAFEPVIKRCEESASALSDIFQKIREKTEHDKEAKDWSAIVLFYRSQVLKFGTAAKAHRVESLMQSILKDLQNLAVNHLFKVATKSDVDSLESAIKKLSEMERAEPSLPDSDFDSNTNISQTISGQGKGNQFNNTGGTQTNHTGPEFNAKGDQNFGENFMKALTG
jgi:hypothetical protein